MSINDETFQTVRRAREASQAISALSELQFELWDTNETYGEVPDWWTPQFQLAMTQAINACNGLIFHQIDSLHQAILDGSDGQ